MTSTMTKHAVQRMACGLLMVLGICSASMNGYGENLLQKGDFTKSWKNLHPECRANGGKISLLVEEKTDNRCGKLEITALRKDAKGHDVAAASVWIGGSKKFGGFDVQPNQIYSFSLDIKGSAPKVGISAVEWIGDNLWRDFHSMKSSLDGGVKVQKEWTHYQGTFKTGPKAKRAALCLTMWESTQYHPLRLKVGDYILFDNVSVTLGAERSQGTSGK